jgi:hypothetical protein
VTVPPLIILCSLYAFYSIESTAPLFYLFLGIFSHILSLFLVKDVLYSFTKVLSLGEFMNKVTEKRMANTSCGTIDLMSPLKVEEELRKNFD